MRTKLKTLGEGIVLTLILCLVSFGLALAQAPGPNPNPSQNLAGSKVELEEGFAEKYQEFLDKQAPPPSFGEKGKMTEVYPPYLAPLSFFNINLTGDQIFGAGEKTELKGSVKYESREKEIGKATADSCQKTFQKDKKSCSEMFSPTGLSLLRSLGVFVQVWRKDKSPADSQKGDYLVDEFYALEAFSLRSGESKDFSLNWQVPAGIPAGEYYFLLFLDKDKRFPLLGTPLVVFSEGRRFDFEVQGTEEAGVEFDKSSILLNGQPYVYRSPAPTVKPEAVTVSVPLMNSSAVSKTVKVAWEVYRWGQTNPEDLVQSEEEIVVVPADGQTKLDYSFAPSRNDSVYVIKAKLVSSEYASAVDVRFVLEGRNRGIFRFADLAEKNGVFAPLVCIKNANWQGNFKGEIKVVLDGKTVSQKGGVGGTEEHCYLVSDPSLEIKNTACFALSSEILDENGKVVDSYKTAGKDCPEKSAGAGEKIREGFGKKALLLVLFVLTAALVAVLVFLRRKSPKKS